MKSLAGASKELVRGKGNEIVMDAAREGGCASHRYRCSYRGRVAMIWKGCS